jgi:hypothetical protein
MEWLALMAVICGGGCCLPMFFIGVGVAIGALRWRKSAAAPVPPLNPRPQGPAKFCGHCGVKNRYGAKNCKACGKKLP